MAMSLNQIVPWGRSLSEYQRMFAMSEADLAGRILGCGDGPASFNAELTAQGGSVVSIDPIYAFDREQIRQRVEETRHEIVAKVKLTPQDYLWTEFRDPDDLGRHRLAVMETFLDDYESGKVKNRYQCQALPKLNFADNSFDLALSSHFLFLYSEQLDAAFHCAAIDELCRVAQEVRIFPILDLQCKRSAHIAKVIDHATQLGMRATIEVVPYEFQRGGREMLRIIRKRD